MVIISAYHCQYSICQPPDDIFSIPVRGCKKGIVPVDILTCHSAVEHIPLFDKTVEPIYRIQVIKAGSFLIPAITVLHNTFCNSWKCMVTAQAVTKGKGSVRYVVFKYTDEFPCAGFCPVDSCRIGITAPLDSGTDTYIFIGYAPFFRFCAMFPRFPWDGAVQFLPFVTVKDKGLIKFGHFTKADFVYFREFLQGHQHFMPMSKAVWYCR